MAGIRCQEGIRVLADSAFKLTAEPEDLEIILFSDNETIDKDTVDADLDEITTNGGEKVTLVKANFAAATDADPSVSRYNGATGVVFDITGALTIYGWAVRWVTSQKILCAENWGVNTVADGNTVTVQPLDLKLPVVMA